MRRNLVERDLAPVMADVPERVSIDQELFLGDPSSDVGGGDLGDGILAFVDLRFVDPVPVPQVSVGDGAVPAAADTALNVSLRIVFRGAAGERLILGRTDDFLAAVPGRRRSCHGPSAANGLSRGC